MRQTSIEAYRKITEEGLVGKMQADVYKIIYEYGPLTSAEAYQKLNHNGDAPSQIRARFNEMRELGIIEETGCRRCRITGHNAIEWDVTGNLPTKQAPKPTKADLVYNQAIDDVLHKCRAQLPVWVFERIKNLRR